MKNTLLKPSARRACAGLFASLGLGLSALPAEVKIPEVYTNIEHTADGSLAVRGPSGDLYPVLPAGPTGDHKHTNFYTVEQMLGKPQGTRDGFVLTFTDESEGLVLEGGTVFYALIDEREKFPLPKYRYDAKIDGAGRVNLLMNGKLNRNKDYTNWVERGKGHLYYRVKATGGEIIHEGVFAFTADSQDGPYHVVPSSIVNGPFVEKLTHDSATVSFDTLTAVEGKVAIEGVGTFSGPKGTRHAIEVTGLRPATDYTYHAQTEGDRIEGTFGTPDIPGSSRPFAFAFGSDSRHGIDSGERHVAGVNEYVIRRIMSLVAAEDVDFFQFTGDLINGYNDSKKLQEFQYRNWKRAILPYASHVPLFIGQGNHEVVTYTFDDGSKFGLEIARFPFATDSTEPVFAGEFHNFANGPASEDGSDLDPDPNTTNFPSYEDTVYHYTWQNVGMIVTNSDYLYSPYLSDSGDPLVGGNVHGYIMDNQLEWIRETMAQMQADERIDHIFLTVHTPVFPNGGHVSDDMFYDGDNSHRPVIAGQKARKGIIERRDQLLEILMEHPKFLAVLAGDEHNYSRVHVHEGMPLYAKDGYQPEVPLAITRSFHHITNGATGAPYYGIDPAPWHVGYDAEKGTGPYLKMFTTRFAVNFFRVDGDTVDLVTYDPETLEVIEEVQLR
jgi:hypothetical protein